jgi:conjugal transfer pilus assembly protein TraE
MDNTTYNRDIDRLRRSIRLSQLSNVGIAITALLLAFYLISTIGRERTVVVPTGLTKSFWITDRTMSGSGLEELAAWVASLKLDISPESIDYKSQAILRHTHPSISGEMQTQQMLETNKIKRDNASSTFALQTIVTNEEKLAAVLRGRLATYINGKPVNNEDKIYFIRFDMTGGKAQLINFKEAQHADLGKLIQEFSH